MSSIKLGFVVPKGLDRPASLAFALLANNLAGSALSVRKRNVWKDTIATAINVYNVNEEGEQALNALERDVAVALVSAAVNDALDNAGYGTVAGVLTDEKGKAQAARNVESAMVKRYGRLSAVTQAQKQARATLNQYVSNLRRAVKAGVELSEELTHRDVLTAAADAELNAKPAEEQAAIKERAESVKTARDLGKSIESAYAASESNRALIVLMNAVLVGYSHMDGETHSAFLMELEAYAEQCLKAHAEAQAANGAADTDAEGDDTMPDVPAEEREFAEAVNG